MRRQKRAQLTNGRVLEGIFHLVVTDMASDLGDSVDVTMFSIKVGQGKRKT
jgi:hypothetical protein